MPPEREAEILAAYEKHRNIHRAGYVVCASPNTVARVARAAGVLRPQGQRTPLPSVGMLLQLLKVHRTHAAVARLFGCHTNTIRNRLYGRTARGPGKRRGASGGSEERAG